MPPKTHKKPYQNMYKNMTYHVLLLFLCVYLFLKPDSTFYSNKDKCYLADSEKTACLMKICTTLNEI